MVVGVNGQGKPPPSAKLAHRYQDRRPQGAASAPPIRSAPRPSSSCEVWGKRTGTDVIRQKPGADPSAVLFDALQRRHARAKWITSSSTPPDVCTPKTNLMAELEKMRRTAARVIPGAPHEVLLVLDATTGQNGLEQARKFTESPGVTGIVLDEAGWNRQGRRRGGHRPRAESAHPLRRRRARRSDDLLPIRARQIHRSRSSRNERPTIMTRSDGAWRRRGIARRPVAQSRGGRRAGE